MKIPKQSPSRRILREKPPWRECRGPIVGDAHIEGEWDAMATYLSLAAIPSGTPIATKRSCVPAGSYMREISR